MTSSTLSRDRFRALAAETMDIVRAGGYRVGGRRVDIAEQVAAAVAGTARGPGQAEPSAVTTADPVHPHRSVSLHAAVAAWARQTTNPQEARSA